MMHSSMNLQPPRSPMYPSPPEVEIPSVEARIEGYMSSGYFDKYYSMFYLDTGGSSLAPPPFQPHPAGGFDTFVSYPSVHEGPYPFYPASAFASFSGASSS